MQKEKEYWFLGLTSSLWGWRLWPSILSNPIFAETNSEGDWDILTQYTQVSCLQGKPWSPFSTQPRGRGKSWPHHTEVRYKLWAGDSSSAQVLQGSKGDSEESHQLWWSPAGGKSQPLFFGRLRDLQQIPADAFRKTQMWASGNCRASEYIRPWSTAGAVNNTVKLPRCQRDTLSQLQKQRPECL